MRNTARTIARICLENSIVLVLLALCLVMGLLSGNFFTAGNWANILNNLTVTGLVALGVAIVVIAGGIDLSFASILACCAVTSAWLQPHGFWPAVLSGLALGTVLGLVNGIVVAKVGANPLITTLGTQWLYFSVLFIITEGHLVQGNTLNFFHFISHGAILDVPFPIILLLCLGVAMWFVATRTVFGKYVYAHGSNREGLRYSGVNASNVYMLAFGVMGFMTGVGGIVLSSRLVGIRPTEGFRYLIIVLTAVLLSGVSLSGGTGSIFHVLIAVVVLGVIDNSMVLLAVEYKYQQMIRGLIFILAVVYNNLTSRKISTLRIIKE